MGHANWNNGRLSRLVDMSVLVKVDGKYQFLGPVYREGSECNQ